MSQTDNNIFHLALEFFKLEFMKKSRVCKDW